MTRHIGSEPCSRVIVVHRRWVVLSLVPPRQRMDLTQIMALSSTSFARETLNPQNGGQTTAVVPWPEQHIYHFLRYVRSIVTDTGNFIVMENAYQSESAQHSTGSVLDDLGLNEASVDRYKTAKYMPKGDPLGTNNGCSVRCTHETLNRCNNNEPPRYQPFIRCLVDPVYFVPVVVCVYRNKPLTLV